MSEWGDEGGESQETGQQQSTQQQQSNEQQAQFTYQGQQTTESRDAAKAAAEAAAAAAAADDPDAEVSQAMATTGRSYGATTGGYRGPGSDPEGTEGGGGENVLDDLGITVGRVDGYSEKLDGPFDPEKLGDDSPAWIGVPRPPIIPPDGWPVKVRHPQGGAPVDWPFDPDDPEGEWPPEDQPPFPPQQGRQKVTPTPKPAPTKVTVTTTPVTTTTITYVTTTEENEVVVSPERFINVEHDFSVELIVEQTADIPVYSMLYAVINDSMKKRYESYYDQLRFGKTLLNFGDNEQVQVVNWKRGGQGSKPGGPNSVALKLANPLPGGQGSLNRDVMVSREIQSSVFDVIKFIPIDVAGPLPQLRPHTPSVLIGNKNKITGTLKDLIANIAGGSGSIGAGSDYSSYFGNQILENYYTAGAPVRNMEINADYSNFENFVTFGSAQKRIDVFKAKLTKIEELVKTAPVFVEDLNISGSSAQSGSYETVLGTLEITAGGAATLSQSGSSTVYDLLTSTKAATSQSASGSLDDYINTSMVVSQQMQELLRNFDGYERELWFESSIPYSASDETNHNIDNQYKTDYTYPKILGIPFATTEASAVTWHSDMTTLTSNYDANNKNRLTENIPNYLWDDDDSYDFKTFVDLIGHHFDNIKIYIKNLENISSRYPKINKEISAPMASDVLESFGVSIPSITSVESLIKYVSGDNTGSVSYKKIADEYYKRYVHALPFLLKTKGTKQSIQSLLNVFAINPELITIRESLAGRYTTIEPTKITTHEQDFGLNFNSGSYLVVPFSSSLREPKTIQMAVSMLDGRTQTILNFEPSSSYRVDAIYHPSAGSNTYYANTGRLDLISGSTSLATSSYFDLFDENPVSVQLKYSAGGVEFDVRKVENGLLTFSESLAESAPSMSGDWGSLSELYIGSPAPSASAGHISASLDEFRMWGERISDTKFYEFTDNPGMFAGNTHTSSLQELYVRLSFNLPTDVSSSGYAINTSPYVSKSIGVDLTNISSSRFNVGTSPLYQTKRSIRTIIENTYEAGANTTTTDMIRIAPEPPLSGSLMWDTPIVSVAKKFQSSSFGSNRVDMSISPVDAVDRAIMRSFGNFNLGDYIGRPIDRTADRYTLLNEIEDIFVRDLAPTIDYNAFIKFFDKFLHLFSEAAREYIPGRARITEGIVIRSPVLNRNKLNTGGRTGIVMGGEVTRRTNNAITSRDKDVIRSFDPIFSVTSSFVTEAQGDFTSIDTSLNLQSYTAATSLIQAPVASIAHGFNQSGFDSLYATVVRPKKEMGVFGVFDTKYVTFTDSTCDTTNESTTVIYDDTNSPERFLGKPFFEGLYVSGSGIQADSKIAHVTENAVLRANGLKAVGSASFELTLPATATQTNVTLRFNGEDTVSPHNSLITQIDDFTPFNKEAYTYFMNPQGFEYYDDEIISAVTQSWMPVSPNVTGSWISGNSYVLGDVVVQPVGTKEARTGDTSGSELSENGQSFVFRNQGFPDNNKVKSVNAPQLDTLNWTPLVYKRQVEKRLVRLAYTGGNTENVSLLKNILIPGIAVSGDGIPASATVLSVTTSGIFELSANATATAASASLTFTDSENRSFTHICSTANTDATVTHQPRYDSIPQEYSRKHFRFHRENTLGARRRTYLGTQNTEETTIDLKPAFEVFDININTIQVGSPDACD